MNCQSISRFSFLHLLFTIKFLILFQASTGSSKNDQLYQTCGNTYSCGDTITGIGYPFRGVLDPPHCGHPGFVLSCDDEKYVTKIDITGSKYRVLAIDQDTRIMRIAREDVMEGTCSTKMVNTSINYSIFEYDASSRNFTFLFGCPELIPELSYITCGKNSVYVFPGTTGPGVCNASVTVPGTGDEAGGPVINATELYQSLQQGFKVRWKIDDKICSDCTGSQGRCGYDFVTNQTVCYCSHPPYVSDTCNVHNGAIPPTPATTKTSSPKASGLSSSGSSSLVGIITGVTLCITGAIIFTIVISCYLKTHCLPGGPNQVNNQDVEIFLLQYGPLVPKRYKYSEIKKITKSFNDKLGQGGYGSVYKGTLPDGSLVAVKVLTEIDSNGEEFINEVASISRTSHVNIVTLLGFCFGKNKRALVYEFMPNKSLDKFLSNDRSVANIDCCLDLSNLSEIAVGIAKGLEYLHTGCSTRIVHFDIKPQNILLDEDFCPKISDFGLAKLCKKKQSILSVLGTRGTIGYIAPEVFSRNFGGVSHKSDVYSYGMMILEMAGARKNFEFDAIQSSENYFPDKIYEHVVLGIARKFDDFMIEEEEEIAKKLFLIGFWCIQTAPSDRPSMSKVVEMLEGSLQSIQIPPKPFLFSPLPEQNISSSLSVCVETKNSAEGEKC